MNVNRGYLRTAGFYGRFAGGRRKGKSALNAELKYKDTSRNAAVPSTGVVDPNLNIIAQGAAETERIGRKIVIKSISAKGWISLAGGTAEGNTIRGILVQDHQCNGAVFATTDVLNSADVTSHYRLDQGNRFTILFDRTMTLNTGGYDGSGPTDSYLNFSKYIRCNIPVEYDATAATGVVTTQRSNSIAWLWVGRVSNASTVNMTTRVRYADS